MKTIDALVDRRFVYRAADLFPTLSPLQIKQFDDSFSFNHPLSFYEGFLTKLYSSIVPKLDNLDLSRLDDLIPIFIYLSFRIVEKEVFKECYH